jgi:uncharacterized protein involved in exopolysaccharide biosynthesis
VIGTLPDAAELLSVFTIVLLVVAAVPVVRSRAKDAIIKDYRETLASKDARIAALETDLRGAQERANAAESRAHECEKSIAGHEARYEELKGYAAPEAFERIAAQLGAIEELLRAWLTRDAVEGIVPKEGGPDAR